MTTSPDVLLSSYHMSSAAQYLAMAWAARGDGEAHQSHWYREGITGLNTALDALGLVAVPKPVKAEQAEETIGFR